ncbi:OmpH family outer membrane protein [Flavobacterium sp. '19STA2R22 D10 B1']|uniref:OmpH family outer membrane protein n=1 Tax=Flavobacterium aerium TaxID=3037261 RepID=UPI00278BBF52|nr:OmpH family outer membrane protein [Flavobacterium sp. '19STA2R22 D10 B1']
MKRHFLLLILLTVFTGTVHAQTRGIRIGYIDMEYILQKVPDYTEAKNQLEQKAQKWKQEIEVKKNEVTKLKEALKTERVLLTKELIEEREEEITFLENELLDYQQKRFGPNGDLIIQKAVLVKPIQDQIFTAVQDISENKKYDFIFDKSSDLTMLFAAKRHDISDQVVRALTRSSKRSQLNKKELKEMEEKEYKEDMVDDNPALAERQKKLDDRKAERERLLEERKKIQEEKKRVYEERKQKIIEEREAKKNGTTVAPKSEEKKDEKKPEGEKNTTSEPSTTVAAPTEKQAEAAEVKKKALEEKNRILEERKKAIEEKRQKILEQREAAKLEREKKIKEKQDNKEENKNEN